MSAVQQPVAAAAAAVAGFGSRPGSVNGSSSLRVGTPLLSISSGIEMTDVQQSQLELQQEAQQQQQQQQQQQHSSHKQAGVNVAQDPQQQQQQQDLVASWPRPAPSVRVSAAGAGALPGSRNVSSVKGYNGSGHSLWLQQQQQLGRLPPLRIGQQASSASAAAAAGAAAAGEAGVGLQQAAFAVPNPPRAPVQVEVHRLGLFAFKGGPPQQEMVQIVPSHLLGRLDITARFAVAPSRKGQLLQKLEGRICEPVTVQLPTLAEEYKAQLPERLLSSPTRFPLSRGRAYVVTDRRFGGGILHASEDGFSLAATNSAPVEGSEQQQQQQQCVKCDSSVEAASGSAGRIAAAAAAAAGRRHSSSGDGSTAGRQAPRSLAGLRVMSDISSKVSADPIVVGDRRTDDSSHSDTGVRSESVSGASTAAAAAGSAPLPRLNADRWQASCDARGPGAAAAAAAESVQLASEGSKNSSQASSDCCGHLTLTVNSSAAVAAAAAAAAVSGAELASIPCSSSHVQAEPLVHEFAAAPATAAVAAAENHGSVQRSGLSSSSCSVVRHDSFRSVASADAGESNAAAAGEDACPDLAACRSSKSGSSETQAQQLVAAGGDMVLQPELHAQLLQRQQQQQQQQ
jgi:hypothetical protein